MATFKLNKVESKSTSDGQLEKLASLLLLESRLRECQTEIELGYLAVNDTLAMVSGATAVLWRTRDLKNFVHGEIFAISSVPVPDRNSPFVDWSSKYCKAVHAVHGDNAIIVAPESINENLTRLQSQFVASHAIWLPLSYAGAQLGGLMLWREKPWTDSDLRILQRWANTVGHAWHGLRNRREHRTSLFLSSNRNRLWGVVVATLLLALLLPVRLSVLAPAEMKSSESVVVRSPLQGVIKALLVESNTPVKAGQALLQLDDTALKTELEVAQQELEIARAEFRQSSQAAAYSSDAKVNLQVLRITLERYVAQVNYLIEMLSRTQIMAERDAIVIIDNRDEMVGRPVQLGERLVTLVDESELELELWLPVGDDIELVSGAEVEFFPNVAPSQAYMGTLRTIDYQAQVSPLGTLAYRVRADIDVPPGSFSRIGMRGTGKLYGSRVTLFYYLFRRPISYVRQTLGL